MNKLMYKSKCKNVGKCFTALLSPLPVILLICNFSLPSTALADRHTALSNNLAAPAPVATPAASAAAQPRSTRTYTDPTHYPAARSRTSAPALPTVKKQADTLPASTDHADQKKRLWNLQDADIHAVVDAISEQTGKNFLLDPSVQGKITIVSSSPMTADEFYQVFLSALQVLGYTAVPTGDNMTKIVPNSTAQSSNTPIATDRHPGVGEEPVVRVFNLDNVPALQLVPILRPLLPSWSTITAYPPSNSLIIASQANNVTRISQLIKTMDAQAETGTRIIPLRYTDAEKVLQSLTTLQNAERAIGKVSLVSFASDKSTNSILLDAPASQQKDYITLINQLDHPQVDTQNTQVVYLNYLKAKDFAPVLSKIAGAEASGSSSSRQGSTRYSGGDNSEKATVEAEPSTNALILNAPPTVLAALKHVIQQLDKRPQQVLIEGVIAEVDISASQKLGIQWGIVSKMAADAAVTGLPAGFNQGVGILRHQTIAGIVSALRNDGNTDILSTPSLIALDNQEATLEVGKTVSIETGSYSTPSSNQAGNPTPFNTFSRDKVGLMLVVTPQISPDQSINLKIDQKSDSLAPSGSAVSTQPVVNNAELKTSVLIKSGNIIVLGGLISHTTTESVQSLPILGHIPLIGRLFQYREKELQKNMLMVFLRPVILEAHQQGVSAPVREISQDRYDFIRNRQVLHKDQTDSFHHLHDIPVLPPFERQDSVSLPNPFSANIAKSEKVAQGER